MKKKLSLTPPPSNEVRSYFQHVIDKIQSLSYVAGENEFVYNLRSVLAKGIPNKKTVAKILERLRDLGAIEIIQERVADWRTSFPGDFTIRKIEPRFSEVCGFYLRTGVKTREFWYEEGILYLSRKGDRPPAILKLTTAHKSRPVFEAFYRLHEETGDNYFSETQIRNRYKLITGNSSVNISQRRSDIMNKMVKPDPAICHRIVWHFDSSKNKFEFRILPDKE